MRSINRKEADALFEKLVEDWIGAGDWGTE